MKTKLQMPAVVLALALSLATVAGQDNGQKRDPTTGQPIPLQMIDPQTGLPIPPQPESDWKDANWKDPDIVLADVNFENLPISEIVSFIRERFKGEFDIILPVGVSDGGTFNGMPVAATDWKTEAWLQLHLKNVTASELFNAMNMVFENDKKPLRWELKINGHRQVALLRVLVQQNPGLALGQEPTRRIYFVGDLIGDEKNGGMSMEQITKTITDVWQMTDTENGSIQFHKEAQLLIVSGTPNQVEFVEQTLSALQRKVELARHSKMTEVKSKTDEPKK